MKIVLIAFVILWYVLFFIYCYQFYLLLYPSTKLSNSPIKKEDIIQVGVFNELISLHRVQQVD